MTRSPYGVAAKTRAPTTADSASVDPTDRSMPRVRMTSSWPMASTAITAVWREHVADVAGGEEDRRQERERDDDQGQDQHRSEADHDEAEAQRAAGRRGRFGCCRGGVGLRTGHRSAGLGGRGGGFRGGPNTRRRQRVIGQRVITRPAHLSDPTLCCHLLPRPLSVSHRMFDPSPRATLAATVAIVGE